MRLSHLLCTLTLCLAVHGAPQNTNGDENIVISTQKHHSFFADDDDSSWPLSNAVMMRDTIDGFYETVVDDVLSTHNEDLLIALTRRRDRSQFLRSQADLMGFHHLPDVCINKMPGMIAIHMHKLTSQVFAAISPAVEEALPSVWPEYAAFEASIMTQDEPPQIPEDAIATALYSLNQAVAYSLAQTINDSDLIDKVKKDIHACVSDLPTQSNHGLLSLVHKTKEAIRTGCHSFMMMMMMTSPENSHHGKEVSFLESHLKSLRIGLYAELEARVGDLVDTIYNDLNQED